jgi:hypothetical protein
MNRHSAPVDRAEAEAWIRQHVTPTGEVETAHEMPWSTVLRVPHEGGVAWFKECGPVMAFEPYLTAELYSRWPDRVTEVIAYDEQRAWLLMGDAGSAIRAHGNPPELWLKALPPYSELQRGETSNADDFVAHGLPDLRLDRIPRRYEEFLRSEMPLEADEIQRLRDFQPRLAELCSELAAHEIPPSIQHDDLHLANVYVQDGEMRVLDWGDSSVAHPFFSLFTPFRFLDEINHLDPGDPWFERLRDAYLEPWGNDFIETFDLAQRVAPFAHSIAWARQRDFLPQSKHAWFDGHYPLVLRRAVKVTREG